jgi:hypothetical protein
MKVAGLSAFPKNPAENSPTTQPARAFCRICQCNSAKPGATPGAYTAWLERFSAAGRAGWDPAGEFSRTVSDKVFFFGSG